MRFFYFPIIFLFLTPCYLFGQESWELKRKYEDLLIYTSPHPGSDFKMFKAVQQVNSGSMKEIAAILLDVEHYTDLFPYAIDGKVIKKYSDGHFIHYLATDLPWPVDDRSGIYEITTSYNLQSNEITIKVECIPYEFTETISTIRMTDGTGFWKIREISTGRYEVIF